jgi:beta-glucosidase
VYRDLTVTPTAIGPRGTAQVRFRVRNTGTRVADEVVQLYVRHVTAPTSQPVLALRAFARITLQPQEEREVQLRVPASALAVRNASGRRAVRAGEVVVYVGASSRDIRLRGVLRTTGARP